MRKKRSNIGSNNLNDGSNILMPKGSNKSLGLTQGLTEYHPIVYALSDLKARAKLRLICDSLGKRGLLPQVLYGAGNYSMPMDIVNELLVAFHD